MHPSQKAFEDDTPNVIKAPSGSPLLFFSLVFALTVPFWVLSTRIKVAGLPDNLPVTDIGATFVPLMAASILVYRKEKLSGVKRLLKRAFDHEKIKPPIWYLPIVGLMPFLYLLTYIVMHLIGLPLPTAWYVPALTPLLFLAFLVAAAGEELGYMGYAIDPLQQRWSALTSALIVGSLWAIWHVPSMIQIGQTPTLMAWGLAATVAWRVLYVWIYNNSGMSVLAIIVIHALGNTGRSIFPGGRAAYELADASVGYSIIITAAAIVTLLWGPKTLARYRLA